MQTDIIAKTLIHDGEGQLLCLVRSEDDAHRPGGLDFPGGRLDDGESPVEAAARELHEEAGLLLGVQALQLCYSETYVGRRSESGEIVNFVWLGFLGRVSAGSEVTLSHEHSAYKWMPFSEFIEQTDSNRHRSFAAHVRRCGLIT